MWFARFAWFANKTDPRFEVSQYFDKLFLFIFSTVYHYFTRENLKFVTVEIHTLEYYISNYCTNNLNL